MCKYFQDSTLDIFDYLSSSIRVVKNEVHINLGGYSALPACLSRAYLLSYLLLFVTNTRLTVHLRCCTHLKEKNKIKDGLSQPKGFKMVAQ